VDRDSSGCLVAATGRHPVPVSGEGYRALCRFARRWPDVGWAVEGATGVRAPLTGRLRADGIDVIDAPAKLATRVRVLSIGHGRKNDDADAVSVGIAALTSPALNTAHTDTHTTALRAVVDHRDDLVKIRSQTVNRLYVVLTHLVPRGAARNLTADRAADLLRGLRVRDPAAKTLRALATDLIGEVRELDRRIAKAANDIQAAVTASGTALTDLYGIGTLTAAKILAHVGDVGRFRSAAAFASYTGTAPIEASSGEVIRHRLSRAGNRQLNCCLHVRLFSKMHGPNVIRHSHGADAPAPRVHRHQAPEQYRQLRPLGVEGAPNEPLDGVGGLLRLDQPVGPLPILLGDEEGRSV
jgi:transposase